MHFNYNIQSSDFHQVTCIYADSTVTINIGGRKVLIIYTQIYRMICISQVHPLYLFALFTNILFDMNECRLILLSQISHRQNKTFSHLNFSSPVTAI